MKILMGLMLESRSDTGTEFGPRQKWRGVRSEEYCNYVGHYGISLYRATWCFGVPQNDNTGKSTKRNQYN